MSNDNDEINLDTDELLDTRQAAKLVRTHIACIYRWIESGKLRAWKRGGRLVVRRADVNKLLEPVQPKHQRQAANEPRRETRTQTSAKSLEILRKAGFRV